MNYEFLLIRAVPHSKAGSLWLREQVYRFLMELPASVICGAQLILFNSLSLLTRLGIISLIVNTLDLWTLSPY